MTNYNIIYDPLSNKYVNIFSNLGKKILSEYIGKRVMALEIKKLGISINDNSLRKIIKSPSPI